MIENVLLGVARVGFADFVRGRGGNPWNGGTLTVVAMFLRPFS